MSYNLIDYEGNIFCFNDDGEYHREDGPAAEYANGYKEWWLNNIECTHQEYKIKMRSKKLKQII
jgi:hypothetical protein